MCILGPGTARQHHHYNVSLDPKLLGGMVDDLPARRFCLAGGSDRDLMSLADGLGEGAVEGAKAHNGVFLRVHLG